MTLAIFLFIILFITIIQASVPYLLKKSLVFGVTIPEGFTDNTTLSSFKKYYSTITLCIGLVALILFTRWTLLAAPSPEDMVLIGVTILFAILLFSMALYFVFHAKVTRLKIRNEWGIHLKQIKTTDFAAHSADDMLPSYIYLLPILITIGMTAYTITQYGNLPESIPTHWGINGQPDAFSLKTPFSVIALLLILFIMQIMMLGINEFTKRSAIKINATKKNQSRAQQLSFRKYTSWLLFTITVLLTALFSFLQLTTIHVEIGSPFLLLALPLGFLVLILLMTLGYAVKVGQSGSRIDFEVIDEDVEGVTDYDDDQYWRGGLFYFNKNDPSIFVEKRFGVGWTINFARPLGYILLFLPITAILIISFLL